MDSSCDSVLRMRRSSAPWRSFFAIDFTLDNEVRKSLAQLTLDVKGREYKLLLGGEFLPMGDAFSW
jgi:hypothetical protein